MTIEQVVEKLNIYGPMIVFILLYLEGLNLSGIPATVIMPAVGFYIGERNYSFAFLFFIAIVAGILGNLTYYWIASKLGKRIYDKIYNKFPSTQKPLDKAMSLSTKYGDKACFIGRLIPGVRAFVSLISGIFRIELKKFTLYSLLGIVVWDFIAIFTGYMVAIKR